MTWEMLQALVHHSLSSAVHFFQRVSQPSKWAPCQQDSRSARRSFEASQEAKCRGCEAPPGAPECVGCGDLNGKSRKKPKWRNVDKPPKSIKMYQNMPVLENIAPWLGDTESIWKHCSHTTVIECAPYMVHSYHSCQPRQCQDSVKTPSGLQHPHVSKWSGFRRTHQHHFASHGIGWNGLHVSSSLVSAAVGSHVEALITKEYKRY